MPNLAVTYNTVDLNSGTIITTDIQDAASPQRVLSTFNLLRSGGVVLTDSNYYAKTIKVSGTIVGTSMTNLESLIDTFQATMAVQDKNLDIAYNSGTRRYVCTPAVVTVQRPVRASNFAKFSVDFLATQYGKDTSVTTISSAVAYTTTVSSTSSLFGGSAPDQKVKIQLVLTAGTGLTAKHINVANASTNEAIDVTRDWTVGETLVIDCDLMTVTVDGVNVAYTGAFPRFASGTSNLDILDDFTTRTRTITTTYTKRYL